MDRYRILRQIGKGAYGKALLVGDKRTGEKKVVKEMDMQQLPIESQEACREEVKLLARLQHRNVVKYYDSFEERRKLYIVMEYCDGGDLEEKINSKNRRAPPLTEKQIWDYFVQICLALKYLHSKKVLHRDLKPSNIFLTSKGEVKLGDFGVSKSLEHTLDLATTFAGTPVYISPEVVNSEPYNDKSDVWSLGCLLYEMAARTVPFLTGNLVALGHMIMNSPHKPLPGTFSLELRQLVDELLNKSPAARPSIAEILQKPAVKTVARRFLSDREVSRDVRRPASAEAVAPPVELPSPEDAVMKMRLRKVQSQPEPADLQNGVRPKKASDDHYHGHKPRIRVLRMFDIRPRHRPPTPPQALHQMGPVDSLLLYRQRPGAHPRPASPPHDVTPPAVNRLNKPTYPPPVDRNSKPSTPATPPFPAAPVNPSFEAAPASPSSAVVPDLAPAAVPDLAPAAVPDLAPAAVPDLAPAARPTAQNSESTCGTASAAGLKTKSLYEELLELGDDFDINNLDLTGERFFKDEIDRQEQARKAEDKPLIDFEDAPPAYDQLPSMLRKHPDEPQRVQYDNDITLTPAESHDLRNEILALGYIKPDPNSIPDLNDEDDNGPENFSHLFSPPTEDTRNKDLSLYDELLALELHNREQRDTTGPLSSYR